ncbi:MAG: diacylglycerol kinase family protein [Xanthobacteraceae bacterium]
MTSARQQASPGPVCVLNGHSVHVEEAKTHIAHIAREFGAEAEVIVTKRGYDISSLVARALADRPQTVVAGGGDGTVNAVAGKLAGTVTALGVIPMGTLNHFAKDIGLPLNIEAAVRNLFTGKIAHVDVGEVNDRVFVNNSGVGFYPHFVRQREEQERRGHVKQVTFMLALRSIVRRYFRLRIKLHLDQIEALEHVTPFLFVGNNRYQTSGLEIGTRSTLDSGRLWVCTAPSHGRRNFVGVALRTLLGGDADEELNAFETEEIWVEPGTARVNVSIDGEVSVMDAPLHYKIRPRALSVLVPERRVSHRRFPPGSFSMAEGSR